MLARWVGSLLLYAGVVALFISPASGASKEEIELQQQVRTLQDQVAKMQQELHADMAVLKSNSNDTATHLKEFTDWASKVDTFLKQQTADSDTCADQVSGSSIAIRKELDGLRSRLDQIAQKLPQVSEHQNSASSPGPDSPSSGSSPRP
jgi:methyl-accepting chemotaxis protein